MADEVPLQKAVDTAWAVYQATHRDVDAADGRRCLLERRWIVGWRGSAWTSEVALQFSSVLMGLAKADEQGTHAAV